MQWARRRQQLQFSFWLLEWLLLPYLKPLAFSISLHLVERRLRSMWFWLWMLNSFLLLVRITHRSLVQYQKMHVTIQPKRRYHLWLVQQCHWNVHHTRRLHSKRKVLPERPCLSIQLIRSQVHIHDLSIAGQFSTFGPVRLWSYPLRHPLHDKLLYWPGRSCLHETESERKRVSPLPMLTQQLS